MIFMSIYKKNTCTHPEDGLFHLALLHLLLVAPDESLLLHAVVAGQVGLHHPLLGQLTQRVVTHILAPTRLLHLLLTNSVCPPDRRLKYANEFNMEACMFINNKCIITNIHLAYRYFIIYVYIMWKSRDSLRQFTDIIAISHINVINTNMYDPLQTYPRRFNWPSAPIPCHTSQLITNLAKLSGLALPHHNSSFIICFCCLSLNEFLKMTCKALYGFMGKIIISKCTLFPSYSSWNIKLSILS